MNEPSSGRFRVDLHVHSRRSCDCLMSPERIIEAARRKRLAGVAVVDHGTVRGGLEARDRNRCRDFLVIPGAEIKTDRGEVIGLFLEREIAARTLEAAVGEIREQGGIVLLPHPGMASWDMRLALPMVDAVEVFNARYGAWADAPSEPFFPPAGVAGSDAHLCREIGNAVTLFPCPLSPEAIRNAILSGCVLWEGRLSSGWGRLAGQAVKAWKTRRIPAPAKMVSFIRHSRGRGYRG